MNSFKRLVKTLLQRQRAVASRLRGKSAAVHHVTSPAEQEQREEWFLTSEKRVDFFAAEGQCAANQWTEVKCGQERHLIHVLPVGWQLRSGPVRLDDDSMVSLRLIPQPVRKNSSPLRAQVQFVDDENGQQELFSVPLPASGPGNDPSGVFTMFSLGHLSGRTGRLVLACVDMEGRASQETWFGVASFVAGREDRLPLLRARANMVWRTKNEIAHFKGVYEHKIYRSRNVQADKDSPSARGIAVEDLSAPESGGRRKEEAIRQSRREAARKAGEIAPGKHEDAYSFGTRVLTGLITDTIPTYLVDTESRAPLKVLSLCSGEAGVEYSLFSNVLDRLDITFFDINEQLLEKALSRFHRAGSAKGVRCNVNDLPVLEEQFDIIVIVSALHHVVEIENLLDKLCLMLRPEGRLWILGEYIGRTGSRLWPDAYGVANRLFSGLPSRLRRNRNTCGVDEVLPNNDCSSACFEGIRSDEIPGIISLYFHAEQEYQRNCFLWRLLNHAYAENYDLGSREDADIIRHLAVEEWLFFKNGGRPTELFGIYRKK